MLQKSHGLTARGFFVYRARPAVWRCKPAYPTEEQPKKGIPVEPLKKLRRQLNVSLSEASNLDVPAGSCHRGMYGSAFHKEDATLTILVVFLDRIRV